MTRQGYFCAVVWTPQGYRVIAGDWPTIDRLLVYDLLSGQLLGSQSNVIGGALNFIRAASAPDGTICWVAQSLSNTLIIGNITPSLEMSSTLTTVPAFGQCGINVTWLDGAFTIYAMRSGFEYATVRNNVVSAPIPNPFPTSQGWIDVFGGNLRWIDQYRSDPAQQLLFPTTLGPVTLGQNAYNDVGDYVGGIGSSGQRFMTIQELGQEPTLAVDGTGASWAWCARLLNGRIGFGALPPFPTAPVTPEPPIPPEPPYPGPEPPEPGPEPPEPTPVPPLPLKGYIMASATTLNASLFFPSTTFPDRWLYPKPVNPNDPPNYLSVNGNGVESESQNDGGNEAFIWSPGQDTAEVEPADPLRRRYAFNVNLKA